MKISKSDPVRFLFTAAFLYAFCQGIFFVSLPFIVKALGGGEKELGNAYGLYFVVYLITCIFSGFILDHFRSKTALLFGALGTGAAFAVILAALAVPERLPVSATAACSLAIMVMGLAQAFYWPPMMGWVSRGHEGSSLSRRLNRYNLSWITALILSPFIGGFLIEYSLISAVFLICAASFLAFVIISITPERMEQAFAGRDLHVEEGSLERPLYERHWPFLWMSRVALMAACMVVALMRSQLALLLTDHLHYSERYFGFTSMVLSLANMGAFTLVGQTVRWHHRYRYFFISQALILLGLCVILMVQNFMWFIVAVSLIGLGYGFLYSSHQYYGVSGGKKRSALMAIHEILVAFGSITGPVIGGYLAQQNYHAPYRFAIIALLIALAGQAGIYLYHKKMCGVP